MHCVRRARLLRVPLARGIQNVPNLPLDLDPSYEQLMKGPNMSILRQRKHHPKRSVTELEHSPVPHPDDESQMDFDGKALELEEEEESDWERREERRSFAAAYGSKRVGTVEMPFELVNKISGMIGDTDKHELRSDAKRLYVRPQDNRWQPFPFSPPKTRHGERTTRDGIAHISVGMPAQYAAVENVLREVRNRLGPRDDLGLEGWSPTHVLDLSAGTGGALWASLKVFQGKDAPEDEESLPHSTLESYIAVNQSQGWTKLAQKLHEDVDIGGTDVSYAKSFDEDTLHPDRQPHTLAISAFTLSMMSSENKRRAFIKALWKSGAEVMVLIDRGTKEGFMNIANARRRLLRYGKREAIVAVVGEDAYPLEPEEVKIGGTTFVEEPAIKQLPDGTKLEDIPGLAHVVAPCPHDGACPLHEALLAGGKDYCHFSQRLQRPEFVRLTKHSSFGEEDVPYTYVVIRRGRRPTLEADSERRGTGRLGSVGKEEVLREREKRAGQPQEFHHDEEPVIGLPEEEEEVAISTVMHADHEAIRLEAYEWPRIVYPPLKRSGHIIFDMCTMNGTIERHTIPKSQGKQPYYDARKASWGDSFPHPPKITPLLRERGIKRLTDMPKPKMPKEPRERREREPR
ncbi:Rsm22-domain-containing protein [Calocera viscosa TUFC12733]|uniref:Rsm22-domain-containing protein n=1 Tax=Calocera viscosa (strain TUFC12733) TaxID=1330018 RepID=A0A167G6I3_CALVF|nr:Rsm22-domain-containing protein [Calocera viscosa TUFC12733]